VKGKGNSLAFQLRIYDPRIRRWLSQDPVNHPHLSPFNGMDNSPISIMDPSGGDGIFGALVDENTSYSIGLMLGFADGFMDLFNLFTSILSQPPPIGLNITKPFKEIYNGITDPVAAQEENKANAELILEFTKVTSNPVLQAKVATNMLAALKEYMGDLTFQNGDGEAGYAHGKIAFDLVLSIATVGGSSAVKIQKFWNAAVKGGDDLMTYLKKIDKKTLQKQLNLNLVVVLLLKLKFSQRTDMF